MGRILVVDDHDSLRKGLVRALGNAGHDIEEAPNGTVAIERLQDSQFDVVLTDLRMGGADGMDVLRTARQLQPNAAVILMTAFGSIHTAVEAMKLGAVDFVQKPFEIEEMELKIEKAIEFRQLKHQVDYLRTTQQDLYDFDRIVGASGALQQVLSIVKKVARSNSTILIRGETGTGKALIPGAIHHNSRPPNKAFPQATWPPPPREQGVRQGELRRAAGEPARVGVVRSREGRVHERGQAANWPLRAGRRRHVVS